MQQIAVVVIGGVLTAGLTALLTAWLTGYWTSKKNSIHMRYFREQLLELKEKQVEHGNRLQTAETNIAVLNERRRIQR